MDNLNFRVWDTSQNLFWKSFEDNGLLFAKEFKKDDLQYWYGIENLARVKNLIIQQWTGITDINSVKIYDGDIEVKY